VTLAGDIGEVIALMEATSGQIVFLQEGHHGMDVHAGKKFFKGMLDSKVTDATISPVLSAPSFEPVGLPFSRSDPGPHFRVLVWASAKPIMGNDFFVKQS
jgi:hypothetical protein